MLKKHDINVSRAVPCLLVNIQISFQANTKSISKVGHSSTVARCGPLIKLESEAQYFDILQSYNAMYPPRRYFAMRLNEIRNVCLG